MARQRVPEGPPPALAVQKLRIRYAKRGRLRFSSTRDFQRALERALRRAGVPMAFSAGFHPHPKISYANAAPTGTASEAEYFEISVTERVDLESVRRRPRRGPARGARRARGGRGRPRRPRRPAAGQRLGDGLPGRERGRSCSTAADQLLALERVEVTRTFKTGPKTFDVRSAVVSMTTEPSSAARLCDTSGGCTAHHTGRTPRRRPDRAASSHGAGATDTAPGDPTGARPAATRNRWGG